VSDTDTDAGKRCDYCDTTDLVYELRSGKGPVNRCIPCLAIEQGQQQLDLPYEIFEDADYAEDSYETAAAWFRILARWRSDDPILKRDPNALGTVHEDTRAFLQNFMGADAHKPPSELVNDG